MSTTNLHVDESLLTGESVPVVKHSAILGATVMLPDRTNIAFAGTVVTSSSGRGHVVATGIDTELGAVAGQVGAIYLPATHDVLRIEPISADAWLRMAVVAFSIIVAVELDKLIRRRLGARAGPSSSCPSLSLGGGRRDHEHGDGGATGEA